MQAKLAKMYKNQFKTLNELCIAYLSPSHKDRKEVVYGKVKQLLRFIVGDTESKNEFLTMVNDSFDGIIDKLRTDLPHHKEEDFVFIAYQIIGLDAKTISTLTSYL